MTTTPGTSRRFPEDYTILELHMIATKAPAEGDDYRRAILREQLLAEELVSDDKKRG